MQVKVFPDLVSFSVNVVPPFCTEVKFGPPLTVHVVTAKAAGTPSHNAPATVPVTKIALVSCLRICSPP